MYLKSLLLFSSPVQATILSSILQLCLTCLTTSVIIHSAPCYHENLLRTHVKLFLPVPEVLSVAHKVLHDLASSHFCTSSYLYAAYFRPRDPYTCYFICLKCFVIPAPPFWILYLSLNLNIISSTFFLIPPV